MVLCSLCVAQLGWGFQVERTSPKTISGDESLQCHTCNSDEDPSGCTEADPGPLVGCGADAHGCFIRKDISKEFYDVTMTIERGCTSETDESLYKCESLEDGSRSCLCHSTGCNGDWKSAESVPCYNCNSSDGIECDGEHHGEEVKCWHPQNKGCAISETVSSGSSVFVRSCSDEHEEDGFVCRCVRHVLWVCLLGLSDEFVCQVC